MLLPKRIRFLYPLRVPILKAGARKLSSRDAYMLIYARCDSPNVSCLQPPTPPSDALNIVRAENMKHEGAIQVYKKRYSRDFLRGLTGSNLLN